MSEAGIDLTPAEREQLGRAALEWALRYRPPEGTYLAWLDLRRLGLGVSRTPGNGSTKPGASGPAIER